jgi:hypothetical protein
MDNRDNMNENKTTDFYIIVQNKSINTLTKTKTSNLNYEQIGRIGDAVINCGNDFKLTIKNYATYIGGKLCVTKGGLKTLDFMFLDILLIKFAQTKELNIKLKLKEYMKMRGLKDTKTARKQVIDSIEALSRITYDARENIKGKWINSGTISIFGGSGYIKNGTIHFNFNADFYNLLLNYSVMNYSGSTLKMDPRTNGYYFSRFIDENYRINEGKSRVNKISIRSLLSKTPSLPTVDDVLSKDKHIKDRIIVPFFRDLDRLIHIKYKVLNQNKEEVKYPENMRYEEFINCTLVIDYNNYPKNENKNFYKRNNG